MHVERSAPSRPYLVWQLMLASFVIACVPAQGQTSCGVPSFKIPAQEETKDRFTLDDKSTPPSKKCLLFLPTIRLHGRRETQE